MVVFWVVTLLASCVAGYQLFETFASATSAPQQAAGAALAIAIAVIPYIFTRCLQSIRESDWHDETVKHLVGLREDFRRGVEAIVASRSDADPKP